MNPAVSFALFFSRNLSLFRAVVLSIAQIIGGLIGAGKKFCKHKLANNFVSFARIKRVDEIENFSKFESKEVFSRIRLSEVTDEPLMRAQSLFHYFEVDCRYHLTDQSFCQNPHIFILFTGILKGIFGTCPGAVGLTGVSGVQGLFLEFLGTLFLVLTVLATINGKRGHAAGYLQPLSIGVAILVAHMFLVSYILSFLAIFNKNEV